MQQWRWKQLERADVLLSLGGVAIVWSGAMLTALVESGIWLPVAGFFTIWPFGKLLMMRAEKKEIGRKRKAASEAADRAEFRKKVEVLCDKFRMIHDDGINGRGVLFRELKNPLSDHTNVFRVELIERGYDYVPGRCQETWDSFEEWYPYLQGLREKLHAEEIRTRVAAGGLP